MDKLTPYLTQQQLKENIDALKMQGASDPVIQNYINEYRVDKSTGQYRLKSAPTQKTSLGGQIVRGVGKLFARPATNIVNFAQEAKGKAPTQPFSGGYMGEVKPIGTEGSFGRRLLDSVGAGAEIASLGIGGGGISSVVKTGAKGAFKQAVRTGVREGAISGGLQAGGSTLQKEDADVGDVILNTIGGTLGGGVGGGVFAGVSNQIIRNLAKRTGVLPKIKDRLLYDEAMDVITPIRNKGERIAAIKESGSEKGFLGLTKINPTKRDKEIAEAVTGIVRKNKNLQTNIDALEKVVESLDDSLKNYVKQAEIKFDSEDLFTRLNDTKTKSKVIFAGDKTLEARYDAIINEFKENLTGDDLSSLLEARKKFDSIIRQKFPRTFDGTPSDNVSKNAILDIRRAVNDYIADKLPTGNAFKETLKRESLLLEARDTITEKLESQVGKNAITRFFKTPGGQYVKVIIIGGIGASIPIGIAAASK